VDQQVTVCIDLLGDTLEVLRVARLAGVICLALVGAARGKDVPFNFPNPTRGQGLVATCKTWQAQVRAADREAMRQIAGVWEARGMIPGTPGLMADTPELVRSTNNIDGTFSVDKQACFQMQPVPGMDQMPTNCAQSFIYGWWVAHFAEGGAIAVATMSSRSGYNGSALPMSCALGYLKPVGNIDRRCAGEPVSPDCAITDQISLGLT
jgi:hypothetical protein